MSLVVAEGDRAGAGLGVVGNPGPKQPARAIGRMLVALLIYMIAAALLLSGRIVEIAENQPLGESRDRWVSVASGVDRVANFLSINRPYDLVADLRGFGDDAGNQFESIQQLALVSGLDLAPPVADPSAAVSDPVAGSGGGVPDDSGTPTGNLQARDNNPEPAPDDAGSQDAAQEPNSNADQVGGAAPGNNEGPPSGSTPNSTTPDPPSGEAPPESPAAPVRPGRLRYLPVSAANPLNTFVAGDSQAQLFVRTLATGPGNEFLDLTGDARISTGLARPDYFNWPAQLLEVAQTLDPELVVLFMGINDWQDMHSWQGERVFRGSDAWRSEWKWRLTITFELLEAEHRHVIWVGQPPMRKQTLNEGSMVMNEIAAEVIAARDDVTMIDTWELFGGDGPYAGRVTESDGNEVRVRADDGVHLNRTGARWVTRLIMAGVSEQWDLPEA